LSLALPLLLLYEGSIWCGGRSWRRRPPPKRPRGRQEAKEEAEEKAKRAAKRRPMKPRPSWRRRPAAKLAE